jgi:hypothetical protein
MSSYFSTTVFSAIQFAVFDTLSRLGNVYNSIYNETKLALFTYFPAINGHNRSCITKIYEKNKSYTQSFLFGGVFHDAFFQKRFSDFGFRLANSYTHTNILLIDLFKI